MESGPARPNDRYGEVSLQRELECILVESARAAAARCAAACEAQVRAARLEERRRSPAELGQSAGPALHCEAWTRGFFDATVESGSCWSQGPQPAETASPHTPSLKDYSVETPYGKMECVKILRSAFDIREKIRAAWACQQQGEEPRRNRQQPLSTGRILQLMHRISGPKDAASDAHGQSPTEAGLPEVDVTPRKLQGSRGSTRSAKRSAKDTCSSSGGPASAGALLGEAAPQGAALQATAPLEARPAAPSAQEAPLGASPEDARQSPPLTPYYLDAATKTVRPRAGVAETPSSVVLAESLVSPRRIESAKQRTAHTLQLATMLEDLTADLQNARIISPSSEQLSALTHASQS